MSETAHPLPETEVASPSARRLHTRTRLLNAAQEVFTEDGVRAASVEAICARADFTRGAFYSNFSSKEELFLALLEREFQRRIREFEDKAVELEPMFRERTGEVTPKEAEDLIVRFFYPDDAALEWYVLETEFLLLAMRDPAVAPEHLQFISQFESALGETVETIVRVAGREFTLPVSRVLPIFASVYESALRATAIGGAQVPGGIEELGARIAELLFALSRPSLQDPSALDHSA